MIGTAIVTGLGWLLRRQWVPIFERVILAAWTFLRSTSAVPHWLLGLLILGSSLAVAAILYLLWTFLTAKTSTPDWASYTSDDFFELRWHWRYEGFAIRNLLPLCARCGYQVLPDNTADWAVAVNFYCDHCNRNAATVQEPWSVLESKVTRLIQRNLRNRTWPRGSAPTT